MRHSIHTMNPRTSAHWIEGIFQWTVQDLKVRSQAQPLHGLVKAQRSLLRQGLKERWWLAMKYLLSAIAPGLPDTPLEIARRGKTCHGGATNGNVWYRLIMICIREISKKAWPSLPIRSRAPQNEGSLLRDRIHWDTQPGTQKRSLYGEWRYSFCLFIFWGEKTLKNTYEECMWLPVTIRLKSDELPPDRPLKGVFSLPVKAGVPPLQGHHEPFQ